jgi:hypothetical protein
MRKSLAVVAAALLFTVALGASAATPVSPDVAIEAVPAQTPVRAEAATPSADAFFASLAAQAQEESIGCSEVFGAACSPNGAVITCITDFDPAFQYPLTCWCFQGYWLCGI